MAAGGGWYNADDEVTLTSGRANFGFVAKYIKGNAKGNLEFQYKVGDINLKSTEITWLVVSGSNAKFKGIATVNGVPEYHFRVNAKDKVVYAVQSVFSSTKKLKKWVG